MAYIYLITNNINGKIYVGKTEGSIKKRFQEHCAESKKERNKNRPLYRAMNKYGCNNFSVSLLEETEYPEEREQFWIAQKHSYHNGYNATLGGEGKKRLDYNTIYAAYLELNNATKTAEVLDISLDSVLVAVHSKGTVLSSQEVAMATLGKKIIMYNINGDLEQEFNTLADAARFLQASNLTSTPNVRGITVHIRDCANGKRKTAYKKVWKWQSI